MSVPLGDHAERFVNRIDADFGQPAFELDGVFVGADRRPALHQAGAAVQAGRHVQHGNAGFGVAVVQGPVDRSGAAILGQQGSVQVDAAQRRNSQRAGRQDLAVVAGNEQLEIEPRQRLSRILGVDVLPVPESGTPRWTAKSRIGAGGDLTRPLGGGTGRLTSATTWCGESSSDANVGTANGPVPIINNRMIASHAVLCAQHADLFGDDGGQVLADRAVHFRGQRVDAIHGRRRLLQAAEHGDPQIGVQVQLQIPFCTACWIWSTGVPEPPCKTSGTWLAAFSSFSRSIFKLGSER